MDQAEIERHGYTTATRPYCEESYDVDDFDHGEIDCECGKTFRWNSEI